jgi:hypothetical protein
MTFSRFEYCWTSNDLEKNYIGNWRLVERKDDEDSRICPGFQFARIPRHYEVASAYGRMRQLVAEPAGFFAKTWGMRAVALELSCDT